MVPFDTENWFHFSKILKYTANALLLISSLHYSFKKYNIMKLKTTYYLSLLFAIWFMLTSFFWAYWLNVFISFPFAILSWYLLRRSKGAKPEGYKAVVIVLIVGGLSAVISLLLFTKLKF